MEHFTTADFFALIAPKRDSVLKVIEAEIAKIMPEIEILAGTDFKQGYTIYLTIGHISASVDVSFAWDFKLSMICAKMTGATIFTSAAEAELIRKSEELLFEEVNNQEL